MMRSLEGAGAWPALSSRCFVYLAQDLTFSLYIAVCATCIHYTSDDWHPGPCQFTTGTCSSYYISSLFWNWSSWKLPKYSHILKTEVNWVAVIILPVIGGYYGNEPISVVVSFHLTASTTLVQHLLHEGRRSCNKCSTAPMWNWHGPERRLLYSVKCCVIYTSCTHRYI